MRAATEYMKEGKTYGKDERKEVKVGGIANRVRENKLIFFDLFAFYKKIKVTY